MEPSRQELSDDVLVGVGSFFLGCRAIRLGKPPAPGLCAIYGRPRRRTTVHHRLRTQKQQGLPTDGTYRGRVRTVRSGGSCVTGGQYGSTLVVLARPTSHDIKTSKEHCRRLMKAALLVVILVAVLLLVQ